MTVFDDFAQLKRIGLPQITVIFGEDEDLVISIRDKILKLINFEPEDLSQSYFDLRDEPADSALEELESLPFFADRRTVIFENLWDISTLKKSVFNNNQMKQFEHFLDRPVESTRLILIIHGKLDARQKIVKKLKKQAALLEAKALTIQELESYFTEQSGFDRQIVTRIAEKSNATFSVTKKNIELLKTYLGASKSATLEDVEKVVPKSLQDNIFDLTDMVFKGNLKSARELVYDLTLVGEDIIKILAILTNSFRLYYQVKLMQEKGWSESQQIGLLKIHPYRVKLANQSVKRLSKAYLRNSLSDLIKLDFEIKSGRADKEILFDIQLIKLGR